MDATAPRASVARKLAHALALATALALVVFVVLPRRRAAAARRAEEARLAAEEARRAEHLRRAAVDPEAAYVLAEADRAAVIAARAGSDGGAERARAEAALVASEAAALAAFAGQGGGPCAYTRLGEQLIDVLAEVALAGFAAELAPARFLCNETFEIREPGAVADVLRNALEVQCGAMASRTARREITELAYEIETIGGTSTTQLIRAAAHGEDARVRALVALGAPRASADSRRRWSAAAWASRYHCRVLEALLVIPSPYVGSTLAGSGARGEADGARTDAQFNSPYALAPLPDGSVVVADEHNHCIRLVGRDAARVGRGHRRV